MATVATTKQVTKRKQVKGIVADLFQLYLDFTPNQQNDVQSMMEWERIQFGITKCSSPFAKLALNTLTDAQFKTLRSMVIDGSELESETDKQQRIRRQWKFAREEAEALKKATSRK
jgi:hypothetical protein